MSRLITSLTLALILVFWTAGRAQSENSIEVNEFDSDENNILDSCDIEMRMDESPDRFLVAHVVYSVWTNDLASMLFTVRGKEQIEASLQHVEIRAAWLVSGDFDSRDHAFIVWTDRVDPGRHTSGTRKLLTVDERVLQRSVKEMTTNPIEIGALTMLGSKLSARFAGIDEAERPAFLRCIDQVFQETKLGGREKGNQQ